MEQEHRITYKAGITRTPSDFLCQDGELAECINLVTDNEELKPVVQPAPFITEALDQDGQTEIDIPDILYIHKFNDQERYIYKRQIMSAGQPVVFMAWGTVSGTTLTQIRPLEIESGELFYDSSMKITSVGKTLIISDKAKGKLIFLWKETDYDYKGNLPDIKLSAYMKRDDTDHVVSNGSEVVGLIKGDGQSFKILSQEDYNNVVVGLYSKNKRSIDQKKAFCDPFYIRAALELVDGTYTFITNPILLFPSVTNNTYGVVYWPSIDDPVQLRLRTSFSFLHVTQETDYSEFSDIVKNVVLFASEKIFLYDVSVDQPLAWKSTDEFCYDGVFNMSGISIYSSFNGEYEDPEYKLNTLAKIPENEFVDKIKSTSRFYKICSLGLNTVSEINVASKIETHTLENLKTQEMLQYDDYYSRSILYPDFMYSYNSRLNLANVSRDFFSGFDFFMAWDNVISSVYDIYVTIKTDDGDVVVKHTTPSTTQKMGIYFYYPDARATNVVIYNGSQLVLDAKLTEHPGLNGAYYFAGLPGPTEPTRETSAHGSSTVTEKQIERLPNYIIQSEVNNPWVFKAEGYHKVGTGRIIGMSTTTQALSQGQFGQYPLLVFSESGIWAMSVDRTGLYDSISPMSRDVCINPGSILQTDGAVFFVSKKGLMAVAGNEVVCVSERMNGATFDTATLTPMATETDWEDIVEACQGSNSFLDYIRDTSMFMAYDYIDSRIVMMNPHYDYSFVYNIADGTISKVILPADMTNAVNNYPDYLIQGRKPNDQVWVYSFYEKPREEEVNSRSLAFLLTRPMKLAGPVSQASLRQLKNVGTWVRKDAQGNELSCVKTEVYLSDDMQRWYPDISRHGAAARYYRLALYIKMLPTERLSGTILTEQERRSHNVR